MNPQPLDLAFVSTRRPEDLREYLFGLAADLRTLSRFAIVDQHDHRIEYEAYDRTPWIYVGCVLLFPIGLLLLLVEKRHHHLLFAIEAMPRDADVPGRCLLRITGRCSTKTATYLRALDDVESLHRHF